MGRARRGLNGPIMELKFRIPAEDEPQTLAALLQRAWPDATAAQIAQAFEDGRVRVDERIEKKSEKLISRDAQVRAEVAAGEEPSGVPSAAGLARGDDWIVVEKPVGMSGVVAPDDPMNPLLFLADSLGVSREGFTPVWQMPAEGGGPWLFGLSEAASETLLQAWGSGALMITWVVLVPAPAIPQGRLVGAHGIHVDYSAAQIRNGLAELQLTPMPQQGAFERVPDPVSWLLEVLAAHEMPVLGDAKRGGFMVEGGLRLRAAAFFYLGDAPGDGAPSPTGHDLAHSWNAGTNWWPEAPVVWIEDAPAVAEDDAANSARSTRAKDTRTAQISTLQVSDRSLEILARKGHPWLLEDRNTGSRDKLAPGSLVHLVDTRGRTGPWALVEGPGKLAGRLWSHDAGGAKNFDEEVDLRVDEALAARAALTRNTAETDLFRLVHAEADGLPGLLIDRVGPLLRATLTGATALGFRDRVYQNILDFNPEIMILEVEHFDDIRAEKTPGPGDRLARVIAHGANYARAGERVVGLEDGLRYWCEPWEGIDVGFFADQRENRRKMRRIAEPGQRWLNLFCHTGAFTVALAAMDCEVVSVDLSKRYLEWLEDNLKLNHISGKLNYSVADDARAYLSGEAKRRDEKFDGIIVDPPTAAAGTQGFWSVKKDYEDLLVDCFHCLAKGGVLLVCRNEKRPADSLTKVVRRAANRARRKLASIEDAPPAADYPQMKGFPEGDSFEGLWIRAAG